MDSILGHEDFLEKKWQPMLALLAWEIHMNMGATVGYSQSVMRGSDLGL